MTAGVTVDFNANLARFSTGVEKAINDLNKFENQGKRVSAAVSNAFATLGVGLSVAGFGAFIKGSIDTLDKLNDLRASTSLTIDTLTGLSFASKVSGGDLDSVAASVNKLAVNMGKDAEKFKSRMYTFGTRGQRRYVIKERPKKPVCQYFPNYY